MYRLHKITSYPHLQPYFYLNSFYQELYSHPTVDLCIANHIQNETSCLFLKTLHLEEFLFLHIRGKSVGEDVEVLITCPDDGKTKVPVIINLDEVKVVIDKGHKKDIRLDDDLTLRMKYPSMNEFIKNNFSATGQIPVSDTFDLITSCIDQVFSEEESWASSDCTKKELNDFLEQLSSKQFKEIEKFFETMPKLSHTLNVKNPETGVDNEVVLEGLQSFFG